jgi:hypothetical protein
MLVYLELPNGSKTRSLMTLEEARKIVKTTRFSGFVQSVDSKECEMYVDGILKTYAIGEGER